MVGLFMRIFGKRLRELRKSKSLSQEEVAYALSVAPGTVSRYESEKMVPTEEVIYRTCKYFKVSADYILGLSDVKRVNKDMLSNYEEVLKKAKKYEVLKDTIQELEGFEEAKGTSDVLY